MSSLWEQWDDETSKAYEAFVAYRDLGVERSIDRAYAALSSKRRKKSAKRASTRAPRHWGTWSVRFAWVDRATAWDREQQRLEDEARERLKKDRIARLVEDEYLDYEAELERYRRLREKTPIHEQRTQHEFVTTKKDDDGNVINTVTRIITVELDPNEHKTITNWRLNISELGRRQAGLPKEVTASKQDVNVRGEMTWKQMVEQARGESQAEDDEEDSDTE